LDVEFITDKLRLFVSERNWGPKSTPKNLSMALACEAAELMELFQWLTPEESARIADSPDQRVRVEDEMADVCIYLLIIADALGVDLEAAVLKKIAKNAVKYPAGPARRPAEEPHVR
jgi:NTP pyrophosphatase (non-canonical NTP hydrolase)